jgi:hypothetical protein
MYIIVTLKYKAVIKHISLYYTLRFYFPCLSLLAQPVIIFVLVTLGTQDKQNKKHTTMRKNESNVNKTLALLHTTKGKDEPNIVLCGHKSNP